MSAVMERPKPKVGMSRLARHTLDFVNNIRTVLGLPSTYNLHSGIPGSPTRCPIANSIPGKVVVGMDATQVFNDKNELEHEFTHPRDIAEFQRRLDRGQITEYVKRKELRKWQKKNQRFLYPSKTFKKQRSF